MLLLLLLLLFLVLGSGDEKLHTQLKEMEKLNQRIKGAKTSITSKLKKLETDIKEETPIYELRSHEKTLNEKHEEYTQLIKSKNEMETVFDKAFHDSIEKDEEYLHTLNIAIEKIREKIRVKNKVGESVVLQPPSENGNLNMRVKNLNLPVYDGIPEEYNNFIKTFEDVLNVNVAMSDRQKFLHLRDCLKGKASGVLNNTGDENLTYDQGKKLLEEAFACKATQKIKTMEALNRCAMGEEEDDAVEWVSKIKGQVRNLKSLGTTADDFMQWIIWKNMNDTYKKVMIDLTQELKPELDKILENGYKANQRYKEIFEHKKYERKNKTRSEVHAIGIEKRSVEKNEFKTPTCSLCNNDQVKFTDHKLKDCKRYPTAKERVEKLKEIRGCLKCGLPKHMARDCKFVLTKKCDCGWWHIPALCTGKTAGSEWRGGERAQAHATVEVSASTLEPRYGALLPTATVYLLNGKRKIPCRLFKDPGSTITFVRGSPSSIPGAKYLRTVDISIKTMTGNETIEAEEVRMPIEIPGQGERHIKAICRPEINAGSSEDPQRTKEVVAEFEKRGYKMADTFLGKEPKTPIKILLGNDNIQALPISSQELGETAVYNSPAGIMLVDSIEKYIENMENIPRRTEKRESKKENYVQDAIEDEREMEAESLKKATSDQLTEIYETLLIKDEKCEEISKENQEIIAEVLDNIERCPESNRLIMKAPWDETQEKKLAYNFNLAKGILNSLKKRLSEEKLKAYDQVLQDQLQQGVIEEIDLGRKTPNSSFIPHNAVFKENACSTKCRIVLLSNIKDNTNSMSHNQVSRPGVNLNHKIQIALMLLRFDKYLVTFDIVKAFLQIMLKESDTSKLQFLWFKNVSENDFRIVGYKINRVPFGMRYSPFLLMLALYYILILTKNGNEHENRIKEAIYDLAYVDNLGFSSNSPEELTEAVDIAERALKPFGFDLQQFASNNEGLNEEIEGKSGEKVEPEVKLLGVTWDTEKDEIKTRKPYIDPEANTPRKTLQTLNSNYDPFGLNLPIMNRAKSYMHALQSEETLSWDKKIAPDVLKDWENICKEVNNADQIVIPRSVGSRDDVYALDVFCDASKNFVGCVGYLYEYKTGRRSFVLARNSALNKGLSKKTMPVLELTALHYGVETAIDLHANLSNAVRPIKIEEIRVFSDSLICLNWLKLKQANNEKIDRKNVYINNKIKAIFELCEKHSIKFDHVAGNINPADYTTRPVSAKRLGKTNYLYGPNNIAESEHAITVPKPETISCAAVTGEELDVKTPQVPVMDLERFSSFDKAVKVATRVYEFICRKEDKKSLINKARVMLIKQAQDQAFPDVTKNLRNGIMTDQATEQLNLFCDEEGVIRVQAKMSKLKAKYGEKCPILLGKKCPLTKAIIRDTHMKNGHSGLYKTLSILRKEFHIVNGFVEVRKVIKDCVDCRRTNNRSVKLNQNSYKNYRVEPDAIPYRNIAVDHCGPFTVLDNCKKQRKVYLLVITCLWSRSVNILLCDQIDKNSFMRALQVHIFEHGYPSLILSDNGTPIVHGVKDIIRYLEDPETIRFLDERNIKKLEFHPYPAGMSHLGGLVESLIKQIKLIIRKTVRNNILPWSDFEFLVHKTKMLVNKRPIAFKNSLNKLDDEVDVVTAITPEMIVKGRDIPCLNILPIVHDDELDSDSTVNSSAIRQRYKKLNDLRNRLETLYQSEFLKNLIDQATDRKGRYKKVNHDIIEVGDLVSIVTKNCKPYDYPMARVTAIEKNSLGEVVAADLRKANKETVRRHANDIIPLLSLGMGSQDKGTVQEPDSAPKLEGKPRRARRKAAENCKQINQVLAEDQ